MSFGGRACFGAQSCQALTAAAAASDAAPTSTRAMCRSPSGAASSTTLGAFLVDHPAGTVKVEPDGEVSGRSAAGLAAAAAVCAVTAPGGPTSISTIVPRAVFNFPIPAEIFDRRILFDQGDESISCSPNRIMRMLARSRAGRSVDQIGIPTDRSMSRNISVSPCSKDRFENLQSETDFGEQRCQRWKRSVLSQSFRCTFVYRAAQATRLDRAPCINSHCAPSGLLLDNDGTAADRAADHAFPYLDLHDVTATQLSVYSKVEAGPVAHTAMLIEERMAQTCLGLSGCFAPTLRSAFQVVNQIHLYQALTFPCSFSSLS